MSSLQNKEKINLIDIGSLGGLDLPWSGNRNKIGSILCFEPNEEIETQNNLIKYNSAIWDFDGEAMFYVSGHKGSGSSLLAQNFDWVREHYEKIKKEGNISLNSTWEERSQITHQGKVQVKKLDTVLADLEVKFQNKIRYHFLKSDTQSGEGYILKGAQQYLQNDCLGLELELYRYPLYKNMILDKEVIRNLKELGFEMQGRTPLKNSFLSQYDALFIKKNPAGKDKWITDLILKIYSPTGKEKIIKRKTLMDKVLMKLKNLKK